MATLDVFKADAFSSASLSAAINLIPFKPGRLGEMGLFKPKPIRTTVAYLEEQQGRLSLLSTSARGTIENVRDRDPRKMRNVTVPHVPQYATIHADDVQNIRAFGQETELEAVSALVSDELLKMRMSHETTQEYHRIKALDGIILDGDTTTQILDLHTLFGTTQKTKTFDLSDDTFRKTISETVREVEDGMGATAFTGIHALCGDSFWDDLINDDDTKEAYARWRDGEFLRTDNRRGFPWGGITWENYRGSIGGTAFIGTTNAYIFPVGASDDTFVDIIAPANFTETVNTRGQRFYAKREMLEFDMGVKLHTQSNVLPVCCRLDSVVKATMQA